MKESTKLHNFTLVVDNANKKSYKQTVSSLFYNNSAVIFVSKRVDRRETASVLRSRTQ